MQDNVKKAAVNGRTGCDVPADTERSADKTKYLAPVQTEQLGSHQAGQDSRNTDCPYNPPPSPPHCVKGNANNQKEWQDNSLITEISHKFHARFPMKT